MFNSMGMCLHVGGILLTSVCTLGPYPDIKTSSINGSQLFKRVLRLHWAGSAGSLSSC